MFCIKNKVLKNVAAAFGVVLWVGALSPEILVKPGIGCILDADGKELTVEDAKDFMEAYFYGNTGSDEEPNVEITYRFALLEMLE